MGILFVLHFLVTMAHIAVVAVNDAQLLKLAESGHKKARRVAALAERAVYFTETERVVSVVFGFAFVTLAAYVASPFLCAWLSASGMTAAAATGIALLIVVTAATIVWLLSGELLLRRVVPAKAQPIAFATVGFLRVVYAVFAPLSFLLSKTADGFSRLFGADPAAMDENVTEEEILMLVDVGEEKGVIEGSQKEMINNIFEFDDLTAADIMTPRIDVEAIDADDSIDEALRASVENGVSRLPVYEEEIDHIIGVLTIKDLLPYVGKPLPETVTVRSIMREPLFVPETKKCGELFSEMTALRAQMAMIVDEYGGIAGIVTMEDLLESIVGNMQDEYDNEREEVTKLDENRYEVEGTTDIDEVAELLDMEIPEGDYDTLGGFLMSKLGRVPDADEHPQVAFENAVFTVQAMDDRRIESVHIEVKEPPRCEDDE